MLSGLSPFFHNLYLSGVFRVWSFDAESHERSVFIPLPFRKILSVGITRFREICPVFPHRFRKSVILFRIRSPGTVQSTELVAVVAGMRYSRIVSRLFPVRYQRSDFVDEDFLYEMYNKLRSNPVNSYYIGKNWQRHNISKGRKKPVLLSCFTQK